MVTDLNIKLSNPAGPWPGQPGPNWSNKKKSEKWSQSHETQPCIVLRFWIKTFFLTIFCPMKFPQGTNPEPQTSVFELSRPFLRFLESNFDYLASWHQPEDNWPGMQVTRPTRARLVKFCFGQKMKLNAVSFLSVQSLRSDSTCKPFFDWVQGLDWGCLHNEKNKVPV